MERKRLHRISLQTHQQQQSNGFGRLHQIVQLEDDEGVHGLLQQQRINLTVEAPKNGLNVLASIDANIPTNGSRLTVHQLQQQRTHDTPISTNRLILRPVAISNTNTTVQTTRKRRAAEEEDERRLNAKERLWVCADVDRAVHLDGRTLHALLQSEKSMTVSEAQIRREQRAHHAAGDEPGIEEWARTRAVEWMQEVCEADNADFVVLPLAVAFLDRMLACRFVPRRNLQALASACLLLASKMRAPQPMSAQRMSDHTDNSVRMEELLDWEMLVLNHLQWNLLQSTPFEFFDQLLVRWPVLEALREDFALTLHRTQKGRRKKSDERHWGASARGPAERARARPPAGSRADFFRSP
uniref:CYCLIN domain-containing protein n=1 Tax=Globodera pallida TaxID=36090 RepID=A0A183BZS5_GLOPA